MKELLKFNHPIGADGGQTSGAIGMNGQNFRAEVAIEYPIKPVVDQIMPPVDRLIDKLEALIPGDQKAIAEKAKADFRAQIVNLIGEPVPEVAAPAAE